MTRTVVELRPTLRCPATVTGKICLFEPSFGTFGRFEHLTVTEAGWLSQSEETSLCWVGLSHSWLSR